MAKKVVEKQQMIFYLFLQFNLAFINKNSIIYYNFSKGKILRQLPKHGMSRKTICYR